MPSPGAAAKPAATEDAARLDRLLGVLLSAGATELHLEPGAAGHGARLRVDGVLRPVAGEESIGPGVLGLLCERAGFGGGSVAQPCLGAIEASLGGRTVRFRASLLPTVSGLLVSLHRTGAVRPDLGALGLAAPELALLQASLCQRGKLVLVSGPAGCGKTTTLHALLASVASTGRLVVSAEHPVEAVVEGVHQLELRPERGLDLDAALPGLLAHGPELVGLDELRDWRAARAAVRVALAGRAGIATLSAPDATAALTRLLNLGVEPFLVTSSVRIVLAQRLLPRLCGECRRPAPLDAPLLARLGAPDGQQAFAAAGCEACAGTGRSGQVAVFELLDFGPQLQQLLLCGASCDELEVDAARRGHRTLRRAALALLGHGEVGAAEVLLGTPADRSPPEGPPLVALDPAEAERLGAELAERRAPRDGAGEP